MKVKWVNQHKCRKSKFKRIARFFIMTTSSLTQQNAVTQ